MDIPEKIYTTKEIGTTLNVADSTIRKWAMALEKNGYSFARNEHNNRSYRDKDITVLKHFQVMVQQSNFSVENAGMVIAAKFKEGSFANETGVVPSENEEQGRSLGRSDEVIEKLLKHIERQEEFNKELVERLERQETYIQKRLDAHDGQLMDSVRELQQLKKLEQRNQEERKKRTGFFRKFFS
ncbi:MerR family transcriptional regulator [Priestia sp. JV24]|uniref:MerR family transcriptional regulator n=1 Tax=Priestia TaxID=2800373 RepID=UPI0021D67B76|nr:MULTISPECIES: MerR family transcriptional regulator [Priestia]MCU7712989.1 MerR family transcriptional regulator [Priestia megaterium]MCW1049174.1 MerR family transcriptional regulator [Priestia sp. JV24]